MSRTVYPASGAYATFNSATLSAYKNWEVKDNLKTFDQTSNTRGVLGQLIEDLYGVATIAPRSSKANLYTQFQLLVPYLDPGALVGAVILPSSDLPFVIQTKDGRSLTYYASAVGKMPTLTLSPKKHLYSDMEFMLALPQADAIGSATSYGTDASSAYTEPNVADSDEYYGAFTVSFGSGPLSVIPDKDGIVIKPTVTLEQITPAMEPTRNWRIKEVALEIEFTPINMTTSQFYNTLALLQGAGSGVIGGPVVGGTIIISDVAGVNSGGLGLTIPLAARLQGGVRFSNMDSRIPKVTMRSQQVYGATASQTFFDGVSDNSTAFTSATAAFNANDVGLTITGAHIPSGTTISSVTNGTTIVLSASATGGSVTGETFTILLRTLAGWQPLMIPYLL